MLFIIFQIAEKGRTAIKYSPKNAEVVGIWRNMTVQEIADVLGKDIGKNIS